MEMFTLVNTIGSTRMNEISRKGGVVLHMNF